MTPLPDRPIAQAVSIPHSPCVHCYQALSGSFTPNYCEVFTQPQTLQPRSNFWLELLNFSCQGTDYFMPFALFTTLKSDVSV